MVKIAKTLTYEKKIVIAVTGKEDICTAGTKVFIVKNGYPLMSQLLGTDYTASSVIGMFYAVEKDYLFATITDLVCFKIAAESADKTTEGPGTF